MQKKAQITLIVIIISVWKSNAVKYPCIISKCEWSARETTLMNTDAATHVIIHHTAGRVCSDDMECVAVLKFIQNFHIDDRGFLDIAYNFLIGGDGLVYEGRGWGKIGDLSKNFNNRSISIAFIGTFSSTSPNDENLDAAQKLIEYGVINRHIDCNYSLGAHRQVEATECPGAVLYSIIQNWPRFTINL